MAQQGDLFLELRHLSVRQQQHLLEQDRVVGKVVGIHFHGTGLYRLRPRSVASVQAVRDEQQWAQDYAASVFDLVRDRGSSYAAVTQTLVAQANLSRFAMVSLLS